MSNLSARRFWASLTAFDCARSCFLFTSLTVVEDEDPKGDREGSFPVLDKLAPTAMPSH